MSLELKLPSEITIPRLFLRPWKISDIDEVMIYATHPEWARYLPVPQPYLRQHAEVFIEKQITQDPKQHASYAIVFDNKVVGGIDLRLKAEAFRVELGYSIAPWLWGQGLMSAVALAMIRLTFLNNPEINKISANADIINHGSVRVMQKCGMQQEAIFRQHETRRGELFDQVWYSIFRKDIKT